MDNNSIPELDKLYSETNANIRFTDEISFKLLGLVPFVSGAGIFGLTISDLTSSPFATLISFFAAFVTFALFMWELRNINMCKWFVSRAERIERENFRMQVKDVKRPEPKRLLGLSARKTTSEYIIYLSAIGTWIIFGILTLLIQMIS
jgi:hypothetical protein